MNTDKIFQQYLQEAETHFSGWNFSQITKTGRIAYGMLPWSYGSIASTLMVHARSMLDMGWRRATGKISAISTDCMCYRGLRAKYTYCHWSRKG
ncbi:hypothetical protein BACCIP111883_02027 [Sutcliffiella rhizosphaerae]|uniref:Uncharacterized protein n=1 Tax=Sutcliffiella rhizosphaerae TaxID=2880967 RepID=A0ABM8YN27_9BACI|nr:hypothetical protein BACCIP111883_02027 [Sutcliffiella rhizosphaerae]